MKTLLKKIVIVAAIVAVAVGLYLGAYLPYKKAKAFISTVRSLQAVRSVDELKTRFDNVLGIDSPVAEDEAIGFVVDQLTNIIRSRPPEEVGESIINYAEEVTHPVLVNSRSPELTRMILKMGIVYQTAWSVYENEVYAKAAEDLYLKGLEISPNRPQFLYGLFDLYFSKNDTGKAVEIGREIIRFWPTDLSIERRLQLLTEHSSQ